MQFEFRSKWIIARFLVMATNIGAIIAIPREQSNLDWGACFLISIIWSASLFVWLTVTHSKQGIDWSEPYSWWKPFLPMRRYPLRFWFLVSYSFMLAGIVTMLVDVFSHNGHEAVGGTFFFIGLFIGLALKVWVKKHGRNA